MEAKLDSIQAQFPASFPESFKTLFAMVGEEEDHWDMFSTLLEDKVIPRVNRVNPRRFGGSLRGTHCTPAHPDCHDANNVTRSNSFRHNRPRISGNYARSFNMLNNASRGVGGGAPLPLPVPKPGNAGGGGAVVWTASNEVENRMANIQHPTDNKELAVNNELFCKHIKYCCLHQQQVKQQQQQRLNPVQQQQHTDIVMSSFLQQQQQQQQQKHEKHQIDNFPNLIENIDETRLGPDGEDTNYNSTNVQQFFTVTTTVSTKTTTTTTASKSSDTNSLTRSMYQTTTQPTNCFASTTCSTTSNSIFKQPLKPILKNSSSKKSQAQILAQTALMSRQPLMPQAPKEVGAYHTKEQALQRVQQQFGLYKNYNKPSCTYKRGSMSNIDETAAVVCNEIVSSTKENNALLLNFEQDLNEEKQFTGSNVFSAMASLTDKQQQQQQQRQHIIYNNNKKLNTEQIIATSPSSSTCNYCHMHDFPIQQHSQQQQQNKLTSTCNKNNLLTDVNDTLTNAVDEIKLHDFDSVWNPDNKNKSKDQQTTFRSLTKGDLGGSNYMDLGRSSSKLFVARSAHHADGAASTPVSDKKSLRCTTNMLLTETNDNEACNENIYEKKVIGDNDTVTLDGNVTAGHSNNNNLNMPSFFQDNLTVTHTSSSTSSSAIPKTKNSRSRTSSMPVEGRKPRLADMRRTAIHCADMDLEYYRLRSFSITSHGVCNLGDSLRSRRSRSNNSVTSTGTSNSGRERHSSNASRLSGDVFQEDFAAEQPTPAFKIAMLGAAGVGKTTLSYQFTTSEYICAYDLSLDDDYGQKTVSVLVDGIETDLEIIDHPACEMSVEAFCSTYRIDLFVVVYSVVDRCSLRAAEKILQYLKDNEMLLTRGAILVGNKTDLERHREVTPQMGRKVAKEIACKFIETSSGLDHNVDELLVGIVAQVKLNPERIRNLSEYDRQRLITQHNMQDNRHMSLTKRRFVRQLSIHHAENEQFEDDEQLKASEEEAAEKENVTMKSSLSPQLFVRNKIKERFDYRQLPSNQKEEKSSIMRSLNNSPKRVNRYMLNGIGTSIDSLKPPLLENDSLRRDSTQKSTTKLSDRTKGFFSSMLRFRKAINMKRRNSSSCSDLFVI